MFVYETILSHMLNKKSILNTGRVNHIIDLFSSHFLSTVPKTSNQYYEVGKYIQFKYFIFKNFILNPLASNIEKNNIIEFFCDIQNKYNALIRFKHVLLMKTKKYLDYPVDLQFNELVDLKCDLKIDLIHDGIKYQFSISDLIRIINTSLSYDDEFFPEPTVIKNPWNNKPFGKHHLYNIYLRIHYSNITMPILFYRFFQSNFNLTLFTGNNQYIINRYIIENSDNLTVSLKYNYIVEMIDNYNMYVSNKHCQIIISKEFPRYLLHNTFNSYIKKFLFAHYSYEDDIRIINHKKLFNKLKKFNQENPYFGKCIKYENIHKLYYMSKMIENSDCHVFGIPKYFPKASVICVNTQSFYIDNINSYANIQQYSYFPLFENRSKPSSNIKNNILTSNDILELFHFVNNYKFTSLQKDIIKNKYVTDESLISQNHLNMFSNETNSQNITVMGEQVRELLMNLHNLQNNIREFNDGLSDSEDELHELHELHTLHDVDDTQSDTSEEIVSMTNEQNNTVTDNEQNRSTFIFNMDEHDRRDEYEEYYRFHTIMDVNDDTLDGFNTPPQDNEAELSEDSAL